MSTAAPLTVAQGRAAYNLAYYSDAGPAALAQASADLTAAERAAETPAQFVVRMEREAEALDDSAADHSDTAQQFFGRAAYRRTQGDADMAETFTIRATASERCTVEAMAAAFSLRLQAERIRIRLSNADALTEITR